MSAAPTVSDRLHKALLQLSAVIDETHSARQRADCGPALHGMVNEVLSAKEALIRALVYAAPPEWEYVVIDGRLDQLKKGE